MTCTNPLELFHPQKLFCATNCSPHLGLFLKGVETFQTQRQILKINENLLNISRVPSTQPVNFASLTDSFTVSFSKLLKL